MARRKKDWVVLEVNGGIDDVNVVIGPFTEEGAKRAEKRLTRRFNIANKHAKRGEPDAGEYKGTDFQYVATPMVTLKQALADPAPDEPADRGDDDEVYFTGLGRG